MGFRGLVNVEKAGVRIKLSGVKGTLEDIEVLGKYLQDEGLDRRTITELDFSSCDLDDDVVVALVSILAGLAMPIRVLKLYKNRFGDVGADALSDLLFQCPDPILELHLSHNKITEAGAFGIINAFLENKAYPRLVNGRAVPVWVRLEYNKINDLDAVLQRCMGTVEACRPQFTEAGSPVVCQPGEKGSGSCSAMKCRQADLRGPLLHIPPMQGTAPKFGGDEKKMGDMNGKGLPPKGKGKGFEKGKGKGMEKGKGDIGKGAIKGKGFEKGKGFDYGRGRMDEPQNFRASRGMEMHRSRSREMRFRYDSPPRRAPSPRGPTLRRASPPRFGAPITRRGASPPRRLSPPRQLTRRVSPPRQEPPRQVCPMAALVEKMTDVDVARDLIETDQAIERLEKELQEKNKYLDALVSAAGVRSIDIEAIQRLVGDQGPEQVVDLTTNEFEDRTFHSRNVFHR